jgi:Arc/MetJ-type ribon-helix-helix transcriptional regulator
MASGRKTRKVTVTVPEEIAVTLDKWRAGGKIESVSQFVSESIRQRMDRTQSVATIERVYGGRPPLEMVNRGRELLGLAPLTEDEYSAGAA